MTAKATDPFLSRDQFVMRNVERVALEFKILMARCAGRGNHGGSYPFMLAMAGYAGFCAEFGARFGKSRLKESMHRVGILIAAVTTGALLVTDGRVAECGVGGTQSEPVLNFGLELLAYRAGRMLVAVAADKLVMSGIGRTFGIETRGLRYRHYGRDGRQGDDPAQQISNDLNRPLNWGIGCRWRHVQYHSAVKPCATAKPEPAHDRAICPPKITRRILSHCGDLG